MNSASLRPQRPVSEQQQTEQLIQDILTDAVDRRQLFPPAAMMHGYSHHQHKTQQQFTVQTQGGAFFIKTQELHALPRFAAEQDSLLSILATQTIAVAAPLSAGTLQRGDTPAMAYLILQHIPLAVHGDWFSAGQQLAQMHSHHSQQGYGFGRTTWCGEHAQDNRWNQHWGDFFVQQRLLPMLQALQQQGINLPHQEQALDYARRLLEDHQPPASLLHGDLWSGNIGFNPDRQLSYPVLFDPASYYGDAEADLAMTELFGRFPQRFYEGYHSIAAVRPGYEQRRPLYQLYHLLNHAGQFGGSFLLQAEHLLAQMHD